MLLNSEKLYPVTTGEPGDPAGNPSPPDHWDLVSDIVVQAPALFGGRLGPFQIAPFERPHVLWQEDEKWRIDPYGVGPRQDRDGIGYERTTFLVVGGRLVADLEPDAVYLLQHVRSTHGQCGVELEPRR